MIRLGLVLLVLSGCAASGQQQLENLLDCSKRYEEGLRWGRHEDAASVRLPRDREQFLDERDQLAEDLRIDGYEVMRVHMGKDKKTARLTVKYSWFMDDEGVLRETVVDEFWVLKGSEWLIEREHKKRGDDMPGIGAMASNADADPLPVDDEAPAPLPMR
jgi:hypothetical protein